MSMSYATRKYTQQDFKFVVASYIEVFSSEPWNDQLTTTQIETYVTDIVKLNTFVGYIFENTATNEFVGCALGFIRPWFKGREYQMDTFYIINRYQKKGLGGKFLTDIKADLSDENIPTIMLDTERATPAETFYRANHFDSLEESIILYAATNDCD